MLLAALESSCKELNMNIHLINNITENNYPWVLKLLDYKLATVIEINMMKEISLVFYLALIVDRIPCNW